MALTPALNEAGRKAAEIVDKNFSSDDVCFRIFLFLIFLSDFQIFNLRIFFATVPF